MILWWQLQSGFARKEYITKLLQKFNFNFSFFRDKSQVVVKGQLREVVILQEGNITIAPKCQQSSAIFWSIHTKWLLHKNVFQYNMRQTCYQKWEYFTKVKPQKEIIVISNFLGIIYHIVFLFSVCAWYVGKQLFSSTLNLFDCPK